MAVKRWNGTSWVTVADNTIPQNPSVAQTSEPSILTDGLIWVDTDAGTPTVAVTRWVKQPANGTTVLSGTDDYGINLSFTAGYEMVHLNGVLLSRSAADYTTSTNSITLANATVTGDIVEVICPLNIQYSDTITKSTVIAKGDILVGSSYSAPTNLPVGTNDQVLVADSTSGTGLAWKSWGTQNVAGKNLFINGGMDIWQRGATPTITQDANVLTADRIYTYRGGIVNVSVTRQTSDLDGFQYFARVKRTAGDTSTANIHIGTNMETINTLPLRNKTVTLSFYARAGANFSGSGNILSAYLGSSTDVDAQWINPAGQTQIFQGAPVLTTSWQRFSFTGVVPSNANSLRTVLYYTPSSTAAGANEYYDITGIQLEVGNVATPFSRAGGDIQGELAKCQRYYAKSYPIINAPGTVGDAGGMIGFSTTSTVNQQIYGNVKLPVAMRAQPTVTLYSFNGATGKISQVSNGADQAAASAYAIHIGWDQFNVQNNSGGTVATTSGAIVHYVASAEL